MSQPQLSVREKAREMFDKEFGYKSLDFHDDYDGDGWNGASMVKSTGCDDCARCQNAREAHKNFIDQIITLAQEEKKIDENTSDGYHTFKELYEYRKIYNATLFNWWAKESRFDVHKSDRHSDGSLCFGGGLFIVVAELPTGQISNHYEMKDWDLFKCVVKEIPNEYDGHTPEDVKNRLLQFLKQ